VHLNFKYLVKYVMVLIAMSCNSKSGHNDEVSTQRIQKHQDVNLEEAITTKYLSNEKESNIAGELLGSVIISEHKINNIALPFPQEDMTKELESVFKSCEVTKEIGQQDGPDFPLYSITCGEKELCYFKMDYSDTLNLDAVYVKNPKIRDQYGLTVGNNFSDIKAKRGKGYIQFDPYHFHMYYYYSDSKLYYELTGNLRSFDVDDVSEVIIKEVDIVDWTIEYIIWRN